LTNPRAAGCGYALLAVVAGIPAAWQLIYGDGWLGVVLLAAACLAARCSTALQTIARLRARLADPRRRDGSAW
jgi:hypothetical protein